MKKSISSHMGVMGALVGGCLCRVLTCPVFGGWFRKMDGCHFYQGGFDDLAFPHSSMFEGE